MQSNPALRRSTMSDSNFVYRVKKASLGEYIEKTWGWDEEFQQQFHLRDFDPGKIEIICNESLDVGYLEKRITEDSVLMTGLYILPEYQCRGIGSAIIGQLFSDAGEKGLAVKLSVLKVNDRAKKLYEEVGFAIESETDTHYQMRRLLKGIDTNIERGEDRS